MSQMKKSGIIEFIATIAVVTAIIVLIKKLIESTDTKLYSEEAMSSMNSKEGLKKLDEIIEGMHG